MIVKVLDILHSDNGKGNYRESKVGEKYERRKNKVYDVDFDTLTTWDGLEMLEVVNGEIAGDGIWTTEYLGRKEVDDKLEIYTYNSIYVCEVVDGHN